MPSTEVLAVRTITPRFTRLISSDSAWIGIPDLSPDNRLLVYVEQTSDSVANLWLLNVADQRRVRLTSGTFADIGPIWLPGSDGIVFVSNRPARDATGRRLMLLRVDRETGLPKGSPQQLTPEPVGGFGAPSPNGDKIAFPSPTKDGTSRVMVVSSDGGDVREVTSHKGEWPRTGPEFLWARDGRWLFHLLRGTTGQTILVRVALSDGSVQKLGEFPNQVAHTDQNGEFALLRLPRPAGDSAGSLPTHEITRIGGGPVARFASPRGMWIYRFAADGRSLIAQQIDSTGTSLWRLDIGNILREMSSRP